MAEDEKARLLSSGSEEDQAGVGFPPKYGTDPGHTDKPHEESQVGVPDSQLTNGDDQEEWYNGGGQTRRPWWKKEKKVQRNPSLDKVDEDDLEQEKKEEKRFSRGKLFGVKSYLHHFYDGHADKDPNIYEDSGDFDYLLGNPKRRRCTSVWWKVFVWIGANFLVFGVVGVLVGYLVPQKAIFVGKIDEHMLVEDRSVVSYNFNLDVCKLVGLILFCIGGLTLAVALLFPSFLYHYCEDDRNNASFKVQVGDEKPPKSPLEMQIPASSLITEVQPERKAKEAIITKEGMVPYKD